MKPAKPLQIPKVVKAKWPRVTAAITGVLGSGKSTVGRMLEAKNLPIIDCDNLARKVTGPGNRGLALVSEVFGPEVLKPDGSLDRTRMLALILQDNEAHKKLEDIVHPLVLEEMDAQLRELARHGNRIAVVEVPLLFEAGWHGLFDLNCMVTAPEKQCISRIMARNQVDEDTARQWQKLQMAPELKEQMADFVIRNDSTLENLKLQVDELYERLIELKQGKRKSNHFPLYNV